MAALGLAAFPILGASGASACPVTNPTCVVEDPTGTVEETADNVTETIADTTDEADGTVTETTGDVTETVTESTGPVIGVIDPPTAGEEPTVPTEPVVGETAPRPGSGRSGSDVAGRRESRETELARRAALARDRSLRPLRPSLLSDVAARGPVGPDTALPSKSPLDAALETAKQLVFPLILSIVVGAFLLVQHYFDRRDPKIALAPLESDILRFE